MRPDIPPDFLGVVDTVGLYEQVNETLILAPALKGVGDVGARKLVENFAAVRLQSGIHSLPEGGIGGKSQDMGQEIARRVHQVNGRFPIFHADMDMQTEN